MSSSTDRRALPLDATSPSGTLERIAHAFILSWGWRRRALAFSAGALSALAQPPFFAFPLLWITFPALVWLIDGAVDAKADGRLGRLLPAFWVGWWFGFGYFLAGLWWVGSAFLVQAEIFAWMLPFAVLALPAGLALFWGLGAAAAQLLWSEDWRRVLALAAGLGAAEWLRGHVLTGFPWNSIGYALTAGEVLMQSAALFGVEALTFIAILIFAAPAALVPARQSRGALLLPAAAALALAGLAVFGLARLATSEAGVRPAMAVRIVQPAIDQSAKWEPENRDDVVRSYLRLSAPEGSPLTAGTLLVWPETAFPFALTDEPKALAAIGALLPEETTLVTGAFRIENRGVGDMHALNSMYVIDHTGTIQDAYDKVHLVPFGEYLPFQNLLEAIGLEQLTRVSGGFTAGPSRRALSTPLGASFAPLICYEIIFPGAVMPDGPRPDFLLNVTNDGWFGRTIGPHQHFHQARVRAVEEGLPLVRAANTGISGVVDPYGRVVAASELGAVATLDSRLPLGLVASPFETFRRVCALFLFAVCLVVPISRFLYPAKDA